ncbi:MAG: hypothetical protein NW223_09235 [Hyphomicrobiaceae bacterium]|nr:hypothetical protein [Hyphomicrobiaceae bacterium]
MILPPLAVLGLVRNGGMGLGSTLAAISRICAASERAHCIIVTNDNTDDTDRVLEAWAHGEPNAKILRFDGIAARFPERIDRMAYLRNQALDAARSINPTPQLAIVMDLDGLNAGLEPTDIGRALATAPEPWAAIFANQDGAYYDLYALRKPGWVTDGFWRAIHPAKRRSRMARLLDRLCGRSRRRRVRAMVRARQYLVPADAGFIPVQSAFGGLGIYRLAALQTIGYGSRDESGRTVCEHVVLNRAIPAAHGRLFISAALRNASPQDHFDRDRELSGLPFPLKLRT